MSVTSSSRSSASDPPLNEWRNDQHGSHVVQFYSGDEFLVDALSRFVGTALGAGDAAVVIATKPHRTALAARLKANGLNTGQSVARGRFIIADAAETLSKFMVDGVPDALLFVKVVGKMVADVAGSVKGETPRIAAFGEMVSLLWMEGNCDAAVRVEQFWNELAKDYSFSLHCAYPIEGFSKEEHGEAFAKICAEHSTVVPGESYISLENEEQRLRQIAHLQHKEQVYLEFLKTKDALESEIRERVGVEQKLRASENSLRELSGHLLRLQDEERRRLGRDLHDSLGQYMAALKMCLESLQFEIASTPAADSQLKDCLRLVDDSIREIRTISYLLYPPMLEEMGLRTAIPWYLDGFTKRSGIETHLEISPDLGRLPREAELVLFRVLQESLTNVHRHSESSTASVHVLTEDQSVIIEIADSGKGIPQGILEGSQGSGVGVGLRGMRERVRQLGGELEISTREKGTSILARVPVAKNESVAADSECLENVENNRSLERSARR